ncbi:MAG: hypothetical protein GXY83_01885 [Rhodopirellula sp.]|nr:hypothetical protein [Rhodopirellula sp.]
MQRISAKATILHTEYHRPAKRPAPDRFSRHYADMAALATHPTASKAIDQHDLRNRVVDWKSRFFGSSWANYDLAKPGTFRLVPPNERLTVLRRDYQAMRDMYLTEPAGFDEIIATLAELERRLRLASCSSSRLISRVSEFLFISSQNQILSMAIHMIPQRNPVAYAIITCVLCAWKKRYASTTSSPRIRIVHVKARALIHRNLPRNVSISISWMAGSL